MSLVVATNLLLASLPGLLAQSLLAQPWFQPVMMLLCVAAATAWLTARWMIRRRSGCAGDCSRCTAHGAETHAGGTHAGACGRPPGGGIRPDGLRVLQNRGPGSANVPPRTDV
jgi:hypothetical protein